MATITTIIATLEPVRVLYLELFNISFTALSNHFHFFKYKFEPFCWHRMYNLQFWKTLWQRCEQNVKTLQLIARR